MVVLAMGAGEWTYADGTTGSGRVAGTGVGDGGESMSVRIGPLGAYRDAPDVLWLRIGMVVAVDAALLAGIAIARKRLSEARRLGLDVEQAPGAWLMVHLTGAAATADGRPSAQLRPVGSQDSEVVDPLGRVLFRLDRADPGQGDTSARVLDPDGREVGRVDRRHQGGALGSYELRRADGRLMAVARSSTTSVHVYAATAPLIASITSSYEPVLVLRVERPVDPAMLLLLAGLLFDFVRLSSTRMPRDGSVAMGPGWRS